MSIHKDECGAKVIHTGAIVAALLLSFFVSSCRGDVRPLELVERHCVNWVERNHFYSITLDPDILGKVNACEVFQQFIFWDTDGFGAPVIRDWVFCTNVLWSERRGRWWYHYAWKNGTLYEIKSSGYRTSATTFDEEVQRRAILSQDNRRRIFLKDGP